MARAGIATFAPCLNPSSHLVHKRRQQHRVAHLTDHLVARICANGRNALHLSDFSQIVAHLREQVGEGDLVVTMGAGDVWKIGKELARQEPAHIAE